MPKMRVSLPGMFANISLALREGDRSMADYYAFSLEELKRHIEETVRGEHTLAEFADHYCLTRSVQERKP